MPSVMLWYEVIGFLDLDPRHSVFKHLKTDMRSQNELSPENTFSLMSTQRILEKPMHALEEENVHSLNNQIHVKLQKGENPSCGEYIQDIFRWNLAGEDGFSGKVFHNCSWYAQFSLITILKIFTHLRACNDRKTNGYCIAEENTTKGFSYYCGYTKGLDSIWCSLPAGTTTEIFACNDHISLLYF